MGPPRTGDPTVGKILPPLDFTVTDRMLADYHAGLDLEPRDDRPVASMVAGAADDFFEAGRFDQVRGHLWMRQQWELSGPLQPGAAYTANAHIADIYRRRDRTVVDTEMVLHDEDGKAVLKSNHHQSFLLDAPVETVQFREPTGKEGARRFDVPDGDPMTGMEVAISLEMCGRFFHGDANYHTDRAASEALGFEEVVVGGWMTMGYVGHVIEEHFGRAWWDSGRLDLKFTNPVWPDDRLAVRGVDRGPATDDPDRHDAFVWIEKADGTVALVADASCSRS